jgi:hypothetical protein
VRHIVIHERPGRTMQASLLTPSGTWDIQNRFDLRE